MRQDLKKIRNRIKYIIRKYTPILIEEINKENKGNKDYINVGLMSLFITSRDVLSNSIHFNNTNDYYASNILIRKVFENPLVFLRIYIKSKLKSFFENTLSDKEFKDFTNIDSAIERFSKEANLSENDKKVAKEKYNRLCKFNHFNRIQIGQYKQHLKNISIKEISIKTYDYNFDLETTGNIMLSFENLMFVIEHLCKHKKEYDKNVFDRIYKLIDKNRKIYDILNSKNSN